jgi:hypothetical protein
MNQYPVCFGVSTAVPASYTFDARAGQGALTYRVLFRLIDDPVVRGEGETARQEIQEPIPDRSQLRSQLATYVNAAAGTGCDLDEALEAVAVEHLLESLDAE